MPRYFSSQPVHAPVESVDRENGVIRAVTVAQIGEARGHGAWLDRTFLLQIVDQAGTRPQGIKARFGHPNMCSTALGTYLGRFKDYAYRGDKVTADLYIDDTARSTPNGNLSDYIMDMAEKNPDMFGASIVFESLDFESLEEVVDGKKVKRNYFRLKELRATDIVDDPAATDGMFSTGLLSGAEAWASQATQFLDENPDLATFIYSKPHNVIEFLTNYLNNSAMNFPEKIKENFLSVFSSKPSPPAAATNASPVQSPQPSPAEEAEPPVEPDPVPAQPSEPESLQPENLQDLPIEVRSLSAAEAELENLRRSLSAVEGELAAAHAQIQSLTDQLSAKQVTFTNVMDPKVSLSPGKDQDSFKNQLETNAPKDAVRRYKTSIT